VETYTIRDQGDVIVITKWAVLHTRQTRDPGRRQIECSRRLEGLITSSNLIACTTGKSAGLCITAKFGSQCLLWVNCTHYRVAELLSASPQSTDIRASDDAAFL
jgi:hypothetical protein